VIYIAVDAPKKYFYGAEVAAPIFSRVASFAVRHAGVPPMSLAKSLLTAKTPTTFNVAPTVAAGFHQTHLFTAPLGVAASLSGTSEVGIPVSNFAKPLSGADTRASNAGTNIGLELSGTAANNIPPILMPKLEALSLREAIRKLNVQMASAPGSLIEHDYKLEIHGQGKVIKTWPEAGQALQQRQHIVLQLKSEQ
jgi:hypothetical protein